MTETSKGTQSKNRRERKSTVQVYCFSRQSRWKFYIEHGFVKTDEGLYSDRTLMTLSKNEKTKERTGRRGIRCV